jgi:succinoglycan biosynthesis transport protein ExoP
VIDQQPEQPDIHELDDARGQMQRYAQALRRNAKLIIAIVATGTITALLLSLRTPNSYDASARLVLHGNGGAPSADMVQRQLATDKELVASPTVLRQAADRLPGVTPQQLSAHISSSVSSKANLIEITGTAERAGQAAAIANAVAGSFLAERNREQRGNLTQQRHILEQQLHQPAPLRRGAVARALQRRIDQLTVSEATAASDLGLAEAATAPARATSPRPLLAGVLALFASLTIAILVALAREQLIPRASGPRDVSRIVGVPVLAGIPELKRRAGRRAEVLLAAEHDAFQSLRAAVELAMPPEEQKVIVVTSATVGEGKTTVAYRLARSLVSAGQSVMVVAGDVRRPTLHARLGLPGAPGVSELLASAASGPRAVSSDSLARATQTVLPSDPGSWGWGRLAVLPSGEPPNDPAPLLTRDLVSSLFAEISRLDYEWILVDTPPLLGTADARVFAGAADALLIVSRLGVTTVGQLHAERDALGRLEVEPLGVVVIGAPVEAAVYEPRQPDQREPSELRTAAPTLRRHVA